MKSRRTIWLAFTTVLGAALALGAGIFAFRLRYSNPSPPPSASAPEPIPPSSTPEIQITELKIPPHATLEMVLSSCHIDPAVTRAIFRAARHVYNLNIVRTGNALTLARSQTGELRSLRYQIDPTRALIVEAADGGDSQTPFTARIETITYETRVEHVSGTIDDSLFAAVEQQHEGDALAVELADIFGWDLDFYTDTQRGDRFAVWVEKKYLHGERVGYGKVLAAEYVNGNHPYEALLFRESDGTLGYFAPDGKPLKRAFLRSPLKFAARVTSRFSFHRYHPILKSYRAHLGVDYAAPIGTPVQTIGTGVVIYAGWKGGGGRQITVRHANGYETMYLHLSRILVHRGQRVAQGQTIGLVGMSGLATGPHLDFRVEHNGSFENFESLRRRLPPAQPVPRAQWKSFVAIRDHWMPLLAQLQPAAAHAPSAGQ